jgi:hypothetical protein
VSHALDPFAELASAKKALRDGLALLDGGASSELDQGDTGRLTAWREISQRIADAGSPESLRQRVAPEQLQEFDEELAEMMRLNAVLVAAVAEEKDLLVGRLRVVRESRRDLAFYSAVATEGERCDISG